MRKSLTKQEVLRRIIERHGDRYDYSKFEYVRGDIKSKIGCNLHGIFEQTPEMHWKGQGCPDCAKTSQVGKPRMSTQEFVEKARKVHGDRYSYIKSIYVSYTVKLTITCISHGDFEQSPENHISQKSGCTRCAIENTAQLRKSKDTFDEFLVKANKRHGNKFDYSGVEYVNRYTPIKIICSVHSQPFMQKPHYHLTKHSDCPTCKKEANGWDFDSFTKEASVKHGNKYKYFAESFTKLESKTKISCKEHGVFWQEAALHKMGSGCPSCVVTGFKPHKPGFFYLLKSNGIIKVGITSDFERRLSSINRSSCLNFEVYSSIYFEEGFVAQELERLVLKYLKINYPPMTDKFDGSTECFFTDDHYKILSEVQNIYFKCVAKTTQ